MKAHVFFMTIFFACGSVFADSLYVDKNNPMASDANPGTREAPFWSIQAAVSYATKPESGYSFAEGDTILVKPGRYDNGGHEGGTNRIYITTPVRLIAEAGKERTSIVGAWDENESNGCGPAAVRCLYLTATASGSIIRGFTITKGATKSWSDDVKANYGGGIYSDSQDIWVVECTVSNCRARRFSAMYKCTGVRTLYVGNKSGYAWGAVGGSSCFLNCILWHNVNGNQRAPVDSGCIVNCTLVDNTKNGFYNASTYNTLVVSSDGDIDPTTSGSCSTNLVTASGSDKYQIMSTATGDFRLLPSSAAIGAGERSLLVMITLPDELADHQYRDYFGAEIVEKDGKINCGAVQAVCTPQGGRILLVAFQGEVDGVDVPVTGSYVYGETYPTQHVVRPVVNSGLHLFCLRNEPRLGNKDGLYPDMSNRFFLTPSPDPATEDAYRPITTSNVRWVDPDPNGPGSDENEGDTEAAPYKTLEKAMEYARSNQRTVVYCKKGFYNEKQSGNFRLALPQNYCFVRSVDGPEKTFICGGSGIGCVKFNYPGAVQGFTLTGADTSSGSANAVAQGVSADLVWLLDCVVSNNVSGSAAPLADVILQRCLVTANVAKRFVAGGVRISSCVACNNVSQAGDYIFSGAYAYQSTIYNKGDRLISGLECYNCIVAGSGQINNCGGEGNTVWGSDYESSGWTVQNPLLFNPAHGECGVLRPSPTIGGGAKPTIDNYAVVDVKGWRMMTTSTYEGMRLRFSSTGMPDAGAIQYDHPYARGLYLIFR